MENTPTFYNPFYTLNGEICASESVLCKGETSPRGGKPKMLLTESGASWVRFLASVGLTKGEIASVLGTNHHTLGSESNRDLFDRAYEDGVKARKNAVSSVNALQRIEPPRWWFRW